MVLVYSGIYLNGKSMNKILDIDNLILSFYGPNGRIPGVAGASLEVFTGETVALVGESGCGKTALCRSILRLHSEHAKIEDGSIILDGKNISLMTEREMEKVRGQVVSMVLQEPMSSLNPTLSIGRQIMEPILFHEKIQRSDAKNRAIELLDFVGIDNPEKRYYQFPHHFSGGMRQRVAIAIALACNPKLLIADEPTTSLDIETQNKIMALLKKIVKDRGKALLLVTHDLSLAKEIADRIAVMKDGEIVEIGRTCQVFLNPKHEYTRQLISFSNYGKGGSHFHGEPCRTKDRGEPLVEVKNLSKEFTIGKRYGFSVFRGFNMKIYEGEIVGLIGKSGCGKSTLAKCMMGIYKGTKGQILYKKGCKTEMIFQDSASAFDPRMTIEEIIGEPIVIKEKSPNKLILRNRVLHLMDQVGLQRELACRFPYEVSGGQRQRAAIARALITDPDFLIADEPVSSLDVTVQSQIVHLLKRIHDERNLSILFISHDIPMVLHISDRIIIPFDGDNK